MAPPRSACPIQTEPVAHTWADNVLLVFARAAQWGWLRRHREFGVGDRIRNGACPGSLQMVSGPEFDLGAPRPLRDPCSAGLFSGSCPTPLFQVSLRDLTPIVFLQSVTVAHSAGDGDVSDRSTWQPRCRNDRDTLSQFISMSPLAPSEPASSICLCPSSIQVVSRLCPQAPPPTIAAPRSKADLVPSLEIL